VEQKLTFREFSEALKKNKLLGLKCKGCGVCVSSCPARAIDLKYYREKQFSEEIKGIGSLGMEITKKAGKVAEK